MPAEPVTPNVFQPPPVFNPIPALMALRPPQLPEIHVPQGLAPALLGGMAQGQEIGKTLMMMPATRSAIQAEVAKNQSQTMIEHMQQQKMVQDPETAKYFQGLTPAGGTQSPFPLNQFTSNIGYGTPGAGTGNPQVQSETQAPPAQGALPGQTIGSPSVPPIPLPQFKSWFEQNLHTGIDEASWTRPTKDYPSGAYIAHGTQTDATGKKMPYTQYVDPTWMYHAPGQSRFTVGSDNALAQPYREVPRAMPVATSNPAAQQVEAPTTGFMPAAPTTPVQAPKQIFSPTVNPAGQNDFWALSGLKPTNDLQALGAQAANPNFGSPVPQDSASRLYLYKGADGQTHSSQDPVIEGRNGPIFQEPGGTWYAVRGETPYVQHRIAWDGKEYDVQKTGSDQLKEMQTEILKAGVAPPSRIAAMVTAAGNGDPAAQKELEANWRVAHNRNLPGMPEATAGKMTDMEHILDSTGQLQYWMSQLKNPDQFGKVEAGINAFADEWGKSINHLAPQQAGWIKKQFGVDVSNPDPVMAHIAQTYQDIVNITRNQQFGKRFSPKEMEMLGTQIGSPTNVLSGQQIQQFRQTLSGDLSRMVDLELSQQHQVPQSVLMKANIGQFGRAIPGSSEENPFPVNTLKDTTGMPKGTWVRVGNGKAQLIGSQQ